MAYGIKYSDYAASAKPTTPGADNPPEPAPSTEYKIRYSDYPGTDTGPPDPARWVGPPGPPGPPGPAGPPGSSTYVLPVATPTTLGGVKPDGSSILVTADGLISSTGGGGGGLSDAPVDGHAYGRQSAAWNRVIAATNDVVDGGNFITRDGF